MNRRVLKLAFPNIISNLTVPLVGMVDVALMGRQDNPAYLGAIALGATVFTFIYSGLGFLRMGTSGFTAQSRGSRDINQSYIILARALIIAIGLGLLLILIQKAIGWLAFNFIDSSQELKSFAMDYFRIRIFAAPATLGLYAILGWYIGMQDAKTTMWISILINLINILLSAFFVLKLGMVVKGVALGTVIGQYAGFILGLLLLLKHSKRIRKYWKTKTIFVWSEIGQFMTVNRDILIRSLLLTGSFYYFNAASAKLGDEMLAVNSVLLQFLWIFSYFIDGFAFAAEALTGKYIGAKSLSGLKKVVKTLFLWGIGLSLAVSLIYLAFNQNIVRLLTDQQNIIELAQTYRVWIIILPIASFSAFIWDGIYIGATEGKTMRNAMMFSTILIFLPMLFILRHYFDNHGMWIALIIFMLSRGFSLHLFYVKRILNKIRKK
ncbi:MAG: MATE family efflux transporter [Bacteroidota bacterium]|nr:MATE family efflux transporter [Bacteroidota bacterium]